MRRIVEHPIREKFPFMRRPDNFDSILSNLETTRTKKPLVYKKQVENIREQLKGGRALLYNWSRYDLIELLQALEEDVGDKPA